MKVILREIKDLNSKAEGDIFADLRWLQTNSGLTYALSLQSIDGNNLLEYNESIGSVALSGQEDLEDTETEALEAQGKKKLSELIEKTLSSKNVIRGYVYE